MSETRSRRELALACLLTLLGAVIVLIAVGRPWTSSATGRELAPLVRASALVALAGVVAVLAARRWARVAVGVVLALSGLAIIATAAREVSGADRAAWPVLAVVGGLLVLCAGILTTARAGGWPALGARYDAPASRRETEGDTWDALDRGEDPTAPPPT